MSGGNRILFMCRTGKVYAYHTTWTLFVKRVLQYTTVERV